jgi:hypothetical protein
MRRRKGCPRVPHIPHTLTTPSESPAPSSRDGHDPEPSDTSRTPTPLPPAPSPTEITCVGRSSGRGERRWTGGCGERMPMPTTSRVRSRTWGSSPLGSAPANLWHTGRVKGGPVCVCACVRVCVCVGGAHKSKGVKWEMGNHFCRRSNDFFPVRRKGMTNASTPHGTSGDVLCVTATSELQPHTHL